MIQHMRIPVIKKLRYVFYVFSIAMVLLFWWSWRGNVLQVALGTVNSDFFARILFLRLVLK